MHGRHAVAREPAHLPACRPVRVGVPPGKRVGLHAELLQDRSYNILAYVRSDDRHYTLARKRAARQAEQATLASLGDRD